MLPKAASSIDPLFADGLYAERGAMQAFDSHARVQRYIQQFGLEIDPIRPAPGISITHVMGKRIEGRRDERRLAAPPSYCTVRGTASTASNAGFGFRSLEKSSG